MAHQKGLGQVTLGLSLNSSKYCSSAYSFYGYTLKLHQGREKYDTDRKSPQMNRSIRLPVWLLMEHSPGVRVQLPYGRLFSQFSGNTHTSSLTLYLVIYHCFINLMHMTSYRRQTLIIATNTNKCRQLICGPVEYALHSTTRVCEDYVPTAWSVLESSMSGKPSLSLPDSLQYLPLWKFSGRRQYQRHRLAPRPSWVALRLAPPVLALESYLTELPSAEAQNTLWICVYY
ncbi:hypothetical protein HOLleu_22890 [Holothuria leucospilota]|uniref:Uncharacterized protein n=1 Tax=Holothuria leucospilota TaxID=206669 RepID=A0A9Q1BUC6_HOLLE|nr:hypothetical protein HOLleu_22890 [Holothuria leucospilota]